MSNNTHPSKKDDSDIDIQACSAMDCTGLIPSLPQSEAEKEYYEELYPYITRANTGDGKSCR